MLITLIVISIFFSPFILHFAKADAEIQSGWQEVASMPTARGGFGLAVVSGKIYVIGGINENNIPLSTVEEYNPVTNQWTSRMSMPTARSGFAIAVHENKIYAIGGTVGNGYVSNNEVYDPVTNTWSTKTSMPTPRADLCAKTANNGIYLIGGKIYSSSDPFYIETNINEVYNPVNDTWSTMSPIPTAVQGYGSAVVGTKIFVIGGSREPTSPGTTIIVNNNQVYDTANNEWITASPIPSGTSYGAAAATEGKLAPQNIYYVGGFTGGDYSGQARIFHLSNNSWNIIESMPTPRGYLGLAVVNDILYAIGGFDGTNWLDTNERYKPLDYGTVPPKIQIISPENKTYQEVSLIFNVNREVQWTGYCLDGKSNKTIASTVPLLGLSQGSHYITIYANDSSGNVGVSETVHFSIDTLAPDIEIMVPGNQTYDASDIQLTFTINEEASLAYSLDGQEVVAIIGNITLVALSNGGHYLTVYAIDNLGNIAEKTVHFTISPFPVLALVAAVVIIIIMVAAVYILIKHRN